MTSEDFFNYCATQAYKYYSIWANANKEEMDKICKMAVIKAKAKFAAKEAREQIMKQDTSVKNIVSSKLNFKNFTDCSSNNPEECELYLCEGLSASSALVLCRDSKTQAYLALRGKVLNITGKTNPKLSEELIVFNAILGLRFKPDGSVDFDKLRYKKIVILCDSDPDGSHICCLLLSYFINYAPDLLNSGMIYVATPPFYSLKYGKGMQLNILNEEYFEFYKKQIALKTMNLIDSKGKKLNDNIFKVFLNKIIGFNSFLKIYATELNLDPDLLEIIIRSFDHLIKGKYKQFEVFGYKVTCVSKNKKNRLYHFDKNFDHYYLKVDSLFYNRIYLPIYKRLCDIKLGNVRLENKKTKEIYAGTLTHISDCIDSLLIGKKTTVLRFKGLAECSPDLLKETAMNKNTRKIIKVTIEDLKKSKYWTEILMSTSNMNLKKELFSK